MSVDNSQWTANDYKRWACELAAHLLETDCETTTAFNELACPEKGKQAMKEVIDSLRRASKSRH